MSRFYSNSLETDRQLGLMALAANQTPEDACAYLEAEHNLRAKPSHLIAAAKMRPEQYEELREKIAPLKEKALVHNMSDNALYASEVVRISMEQLTERLAEGRIAPQFLSRVARDVADVQAKSIDKKLALEGRPTSIAATLSPTEVMRQLERMNVLKPAKPIEITQGD